MTRDQPVVLPRMIVAATAHGVCRLPMRNTICRMKLSRHGPSVPRSLQTTQPHLLTVADSADTSGHLPPAFPGAGGHST